MGYVTGISEFFKNSTSVGGARSTSGIVVGGSAVEESEVRDIRGVGSHKPQQQREGIVRASGNVNLTVQDEGILALAERNGSGILTEFDIEAGSASESQIHKNCKIDSLTLECVAGGELMASLAWKGLYSTAGAGGTHSPSTDNVLEWYEGALAGISGLELAGFTLNIAHNTDWQPVIVNNLTPKRRASYIIEKAQNIGVNLRVLEPESADLMANSIALVSSVTITFTGTNTVTLTLINLKRGAHERPMTPNEVIQYGANFSVENFTIT